MNLTATAPACRSTSTLLQTQMIASQFTRVVVDVTFMSVVDGRPIPTPSKSQDSVQVRKIYTNVGATCTDEETSTAWLGRSQRGWRQVTPSVVSLSKNYLRYWCCPVAIYIYSSRRWKRGRLQRLEGWCVTCRLVGRDNRVTVTIERVELWLGTCAALMYRPIHAKTNCRPRFDRLFSSYYAPA